jgi:hypothetical protein
VLPLTQAREFQFRAKGEATMGYGITGRFGSNSYEAKSRRWRCALSGMVATSLLLMPMSFSAPLMLRQLGKSSDF